MNLDLDTYTEKKRNRYNQLYMDIAKRLAQMSYAKRLQVGAVAVKDGRILSFGFNGMPSGFPNDCEDDTGKTRPEVLHAEANLIAKLCRSGEAANGGILYCTHSCCMECSKLILSSGFSKFIYETEYRSEEGLFLLKRCGVEVEKITQNPV